MKDMDLSVVVSFLVLDNKLLILLTNLKLKTLTSVDKTIQIKLLKVIIAHAVKLFIRQFLNNNFWRKKPTGDKQLSMQVSVNGIECNNVHLNYNSADFCGILEVCYTNIETFTAYCLVLCTCVSLIGHFEIVHFKSDIASLFVH